MGNVKVEGLSQIHKALSELGRKVSNKIAVKAMREGGKIVQEQARQNAPVISQSTPYRRAGTLKKAIKSSTKVLKNGKIGTVVRVKTLTTKQIETFKVRSGKKGALNPKDPYYWRFLEFGTSKMPAKPFMRPAFEQTKEKAATEIIKTLKDGIESEAGK
jgi:bacteriophage protein of unknown function (DUF646)